MNICFFGSAPIAVETLDTLIASRLPVSAVFSQPDRPAGRGGKLHMTAVKERALQLGLPVYTPEKLRAQETIDALARYQPDLVVVVAYGRLIPQCLLSIPTHGFVNLHASILPKYRGAAPVPFAILNNEKETGVTVFRLNERFDAGDILAIERLPILPDDTSESVLRKLAPLGANLVCKVVGELEAGWTHPVVQTEPLATHAPKIAKEEGLLDWRETPVKIDCRVRAFQPWPLCYCFVGPVEQQKRLCLLKVAEFAPGGRGHAPGEILAADPHAGLIVACGGGKAISILRLKPEGRKEMDVADYLRGAHLQPGQRLAGAAELHMQQSAVAGSCQS